MTEVTAHALGEMRVFTRVGLVDKSLDFDGPIEKLPAAIEFYKQACFPEDPDLLRQMRADLTLARWQRRQARSAEWRWRREALRLRTLMAVQAFHAAGFSWPNDPQIQGAPK